MPTTTRGPSFVEVYQNCNVFNDGAFEQVNGKDNRAEMLIPLEHGEPIRFGADGEHGVDLGRPGQPSPRRGGRRRRGQALLVHDEKREDPGLAFALSQARQRAARADADRRVPGGRATGLRLARRQPAPPGERARRPR